MRKRYQRRPEQAVTAIQMTMDFEGLRYTKWGDSQKAQRNDWLVDNGHDVYTVAADSFSATYRALSPGRWLKTAPVWAERAAQAGSVATLEGRTHHEAGDWLVSNNEDGSDAYAISAAQFDRLYEPDTNGGTNTDLAGSSP